MRHILCANWCMLFKQSELQKLFLAHNLHFDPMVGNICCAVIANTANKTDMALADSDYVYTLRPRQNGPHFPDDIFKYIFLNENIRISIKVSLKFVPKGSITNIPALVQTMAWRRPGDKPLSEPMMDSLLMHICVTRPQLVKITCVCQRCVASNI